MRDVSDLRPYLRQHAIDAWLLYDFKGQNPTARAAVGLTPAWHLTRRWFYLVPADGEPELLIHAIERDNFPPVSGRRQTYASWDRLRAALAALLRGRRRIAMEYCPLGTIPYLSRVDAGTVELVRSFGVEVVSSADLVQYHQCRWTDAELETHRRALADIDGAKDQAFAHVGDELRAGRQPSEASVQAFLMTRFEERGLITDHPPIVAVNSHAGNPHYAPSPATSAPIRRGDLLLIDLWARERADGSKYADITWTAMVGAPPGSEIARVFDVVVRARDAGLAFVDGERKQGRRVEGWQADQVVRRVVADAGFGERFIHRTGHNINDQVHGDGANLDSLETHDTRELIPRTCFSIEPGVYLEAFGIRSEIDVYLDERGAQVFSPIQRELVRIEA